MKKSIHIHTELITVIILISFASCKQKITGNGYFGTQFTIEQPITADDINSFIGEDSDKKAQVSGTIEKVCKAKFCWLSMTDSKGERYYMNVKDEAFKLPVDCEGKKVVVYGTLQSVSKQQEKARDMGLKESYVESIKNVSMEAEGFYIEEPGA